jgi:hypothetical protein
MFLAGPFSAIALSGTPKAHSLRNGPARRGRAAKLFQMLSLEDLDALLVEPSRRADQRG